MIKFNKPAQLNGEQLVQELKAIGVIVNENTSPLIDGDDNFWLDIPTKDKTKAQTVVDKHIGTDNKQAKIAARQAIADRLGLTADELQVLLG
jgi:hypothetical protein